MLQGAMSALRNPKALANITITAEDSKVLAQYLADVVQKGPDNVLDSGGISLPRLR